MNRHESKSVTDSTGVSYVNNTVGQTFMVSSNDQIKETDEESTSDESINLESSSVLSETESESFLSEFSDIDFSAIEQLVKEELKREMNTESDDEKNEVNMLMINKSNEARKEGCMKIDKKLAVHQAEVNESKVNFIFDTASVTSFITENLAKRLNLEYHETTDKKCNSYEGMGVNIFKSTKDKFVYIEVKIKLADGSTVDKLGIAQVINKISNCKKFELLIGMNFEMGYHGIDVRWVVIQ